jgi:hypothetical protein
MFKKGLKGILTLHLNFLEGLCLYIRVFYNKRNIALAIGDSDLAIIGLKYSTHEFE